MEKTKLLFGDHEPREEIKTRIPVWLYPSTLEVIDRAAETANCKSRSEYLERAALFYAGYISGQDATAYLPPALSKAMRGIVRDTENRISRMLFKLAVELDKDVRISQAYGLWYELRDEVLRTYRKDLPKRLPLSRQKEFRQIPNLVIQEAVRLGEIGTVFPPLEADEPVIPSPEWQTLAVVDTPPEQVQMLLKQLTQAAEAGRAPAQYALGRLYRDGGPVEKTIFAQ